MGLGEKKNLLRGMYRPAEGEAAAGGGGGHGTEAPKVEARVEAAIYRVAYGAMYVMFVIGVGAMVLMLRMYYLAGLSLGHMPGVEQYVQSALLLMGLAVFLNLLGTAAFIFFRSRWSRGGRWVGLGALLSLLPLTVVGVCFFGVCTSAGRMEGLRRLDAKQLRADAEAMEKIFELSGAEAREVDGMDPEFTRVPAYTSGGLHPTGVRVYPKGVVVMMEGGRYTWREAEGLIVPTGKMTAAEAKTIAEEEGMKVISEEPVVLRFERPVEVRFLEAEGHASTLPAMGEWGP